MTKPLRTRSVVANGLLGLVILLAPASAHALRTGQNFACVNCHEGQDKPEVVATLSAMRVEPGESVTITVTTTHPTALVGGVLVDSKDVGAFEIIDPMETHLFEDVPTQATHAVPKPYTDGQVEFSFNWIAPETVGPVEFEVWANAANDNLDPHDDSAQGTTANIGVGCDALWYYADEDADGLGDDATGVYSCEPIAEFINQGGDCDDQNPEVNANVVEICNGVDDDCDGEVDEDFEKKLWVADMDGDGHGSPSGESQISCAEPAGFAPSFDDCDDESADVNPSAIEIPNGIDDNCNGMIDEAAAPEATPETGVTPEGTGGGPATLPPAPAGSGTTAPTPSAMPAPVASTPTAATTMPGVVQPGPTQMPPASDEGTSCAFNDEGSWSAPSTLTLVTGLVLLGRRRRSSRRA